MGANTWEGSKAAANREACEPVQTFAEQVTTWRHDDESVTIRAANRPLRVLIVDENTDLAYMMSVLVQKCGHEVQIAYDGPTALKMVAALHPDVAFVDIAMPKMDGLCLARELRRSSVVDDCLLIAVTGYADADHHALGMQAGFDHYLIKPVAFRTLSELLLLARNRLVRSVEEAVAMNEADEVNYASAIC
ncbi:MAG: response regulator [Pirellulales bacterium]